MKRIFKKTKKLKAQPRATGWILTKLDEIKVNIATLEDVDIVNKVSDEDINTIRAQIKEIQDFIGSKDDPSIDYSSIVVELSELETRLSSVESRLSTAESQISTLQTQVAELAAVDVVLLAADANLNNRVNDNTSKNTQQDARLTSLETISVGSKKDFAVMTTTGTLDTTVKVMKPVITKDFNTTYNLAVNTINPTTQELSTKVNQNSNVTTNFYFNATQLSGNLVEVTVELYNLTKAVVIDKAVSKLDFSGSIEINSGTRFNLGVVDKDDVIQVRGYTNTGSVTLTSSGLNFEVETIQGVTDVIFDYNVTSTSNWGGLNTKEDLNLAKQSETTLSTSINSVNTDLQKFKQDLYDHQFVVGYIYDFPGTVKEPNGEGKYDSYDVNATLPDGIVAVWEKVLPENVVVGELSKRFHTSNTRFDDYKPELIGSLQKGNVGSHNHRLWSSFKGEKGNDNGDGMPGLGSVTAWDSNGNTKTGEWYGANETEIDENGKNLYTSKVGEKLGDEEFNVAAGINTGLWPWKRIS